MTNEEAIKQLKKCKSFHNGSYGTALDLAIKALGSWEKFSDKVWKRAYARGCNDVLDKIREEIKELADYDNVDALVEVCRIIDKYKAESEDKE